jgi:hypothetical protein
MNWYGHSEPEVFSSVDEIVTACEIAFIDAGFERCEVADALVAYEKYLRDGCRGPFRFEIDGEVA